MNAFLPIGIVFVAVGLGLSFGQSMEQGIAFLVIGFTFVVLATTSNEDDDEDDEDEQ